MYGIRVCGDLLLSKATSFLDSKRISTLVLRAASNSCMVMLCVCATCSVSVPEQKIFVPHPQTYPSKPIRLKRGSTFWKAAAGINKHQMTKGARMSNGIYGTLRQGTVDLEVSSVNIKKAIFFIG